jgi:hypothetical protein
VQVSISSRVPARNFFLGAADLVFEFVADVEVVFQRTLAPTGDDGHVLQAGVPCFFNGVFDQRLVDDRQHFFRHGFGRRQETRAVTGSGEQTFTNHKSILDSHGTQATDARTYQSAQVSMIIERVL